MPLQIQTHPDEYPLSVAEVSLHLENVIVETEDDADVARDDYLNALIAAATDLVENQTQRQLISATYDLYLDDFPAGGIIVLPKPPLQSVTFIKYYDSGNIFKTLSALNYEVDTVSRLGRILLNAEQSWPDTYNRAFPVIIRFTCGYGDKYDVPQQIKQAIQLLVAQWNENRETAGSKQDELPFSVNALLYPYKIFGNI